jgi:hypothetical protein
MIGIGIMTAATIPRTLDAHRGFNASNICRAKSCKVDEDRYKPGKLWNIHTGNAAPKMLRDTVLAANADAAANRYASTV